MLLRSSHFCSHPHGREVVHTRKAGCCSSTLPSSLLAPRGLRPHPQILAVPPPQHRRPQAPVARRALPSPSREVLA